MTDRVRLTSIMKGGVSHELLSRNLPQCRSKCNSIFHLQMARQ